MGEDLKASSKPLRIKLYEKNVLTPELIGKDVLIDVEVIGESDWFAVPQKIDGYCDACDQEFHVDISTLMERDPDFLMSLTALRYVDIISEVKKIMMAQGECPNTKNHRHRPVVIVTKRSGYRIFRVRDKRLVLLAKKFEPLEANWFEFTPTDEEKREFEKYFKLRSYEELKEIMDKTIATDIVGIPFAKLVAALVLASPLYITRPDGREIRGWLRAMFYGDTRCGKSSIIRWITLEAGLGERTTGDG